MKKTLLILAMIASSVLFSCNPDNNDDDDSPSNPSSNEINGHKYVDLGLSVKWATCNVGAENPGDYGDYFAWGETETKSYYDEDNCDTYGVEMDDISGDPDYDVANKKWGGTWRMPTRYEMEELVEECEWEWIEAEVNGISGCRVTGPNGNHIFLPAADHRFGTSLDSDGGDGYYWSSTPHGNYDSSAYFLIFSDGLEELDVGYGFPRFIGQPVRPVSG